MRPRNNRYLPLSADPPGVETDDVEAFNDFINDASRSS